MGCSSGVCDKINDNRCCYECENIKICDNICNNCKKKEYSKKNYKDCNKYEK